jgi:hypothetical protein
VGLCRAPSAVSFDEISSLVAITLLRICFVNHRVVTRGWVLHSGTTF